MFVTELDSFVYKFHQLWNAGHSAHLDLDTHGLACVSSLDMHQVLLIFQTTSNHLTKKTVHHDSDAVQDEQLLDR